MASHILADISRLDLADLSATDGKITGLQHVASYNWLERPEPTVLVPGYGRPCKACFRSVGSNRVAKGCPPLWSPPSIPLKLSQDSGMVYIDQNAARNPRFPLESLFRALFVESPESNISDVDLVTDKNNIRKLLRFVQASPNNTFQIRVEIAGDKTALFTRVEDKTKEIIQGFRGYGHNFEKAYTKIPSGSTAHHRVVGYTFGGLKCVVRHETDGYVEKESTQKLYDNLADALKGLSISKLGGVMNRLGEVTVETGGRVVDVSSTLEIKTRAAGRVLDMAEVSSQLWISQNPNLVVGYHRSGVFDNIQLRDMTKELRRWEITNQRDLCRLAGLLTKIIEVIKRSGTRSALVRYDGHSKLRVFATSEGKGALPKDLYAKWERKGKEAIEDSTQACQEDITKLRIKDNESQAMSGQRPPSGWGTHLPLIPHGTPSSNIIAHALLKGLPSKTTSSSVSVRGSQ